MAKEKQSVGGPPPEKPESDAKMECAQGVGALLRASRLRCGEDLRYVSEMLHIRYLYLEAIEDGRFHDLPGPTYTIGFIRAYADHLGLDSDEVVRRLKEDTSGSNGMTELYFPVPIPESVVPGGAVLLVGIVLAILAYGGWYISSSDDRIVSELTSPVPDRFGPDRFRTDQQTLPDSKDAGAVAPALSAAAKVDEVVTIKKAEEKTAPIRQPDNPVAVAPPKPVPTKKQNAPEPDAPGQDISAGHAPAPAEAVLAESGNDIAVEAPAKSKADPATGKTDNKADGQTEAVDDNVSVGESLSTPKAEPDNNAATVTEAAAPADTADKKQVVAEPVTEPHPTPVDNSAPSSSPPSADGSSSTPEVPSALKSEPDVAASDIPAGRTYGLDNDGSRITVRANTDSWIQVRDDIANQLLLTRLLRRGDSYRVPDRPGLKLLTGNAGALDILIDGESVPSIGATGVVRRGVALDVERLRQGAAVIE